MDLLQLLNNLLNVYTIKDISDKLNLSTGTVKRWLLLNNIPSNYEFDLLKLSDIDINYDNYSTKQKDQFFTPSDIAKECFDIFKKVIIKYNDNIDDFIFIEPSAGDGSFLSILPDNTIALDIEPRNTKIIKSDFLSWSPENKNTKYIVFGNPPFGLRGHLALKFINHSYNFADYVCFILPQLFESDGKGSPRKRIIGYNLLHSSKLLCDFYEPNGNLVKINTIFQVWSKNNINKEYIIKNLSNTNIKIYSISNGNSSSSKRNVNMIDKCDLYLPSTCFNKTLMKCYNKFDNLPNKRGYGLVFLKNKSIYMDKALKTKWENIAFLSTNSAYNLRSSQIYELFNI